MTHTPLDVSIATRKHDLLQMIANQVLDLLETEKITPAQSKEASNFVLDHLRPAVTQEQIDHVLKQINAKWPDFNFVQEPTKLKERSQEESQVMSKLKQFIQTQS